MVMSANSDRRYNLTFGFSVRNVFNKVTWQIRAEFWGRRFSVFRTRFKAAHFPVDGAAPHRSAGNVQLLICRHCGRHIAKLRIRVMLKTETARRAFQKRKRPKSIAFSSNQQANIPPPRSRR